MQTITKAVRRDLTELLVKIDIQIRIANLIVEDVDAFLNENRTNKGLGNLIACEGYTDIISLKGIGSEKEKELWIYNEIKSRKEQKDSKSGILSKGQIEYQAGEMYKEAEQNLIDKCTFLGNTTRELLKTLSKLKRLFKAIELVYDVDYVPQKYLNYKGADTELKVLDLSKSISQLEKYIVGTTGEI